MGMNKRTDHTIGKKSAMSDSDDSSDYDDVSMSSSENDSDDDSVTEVPKEQDTTEIQEDIEEDEIIRAIIKENQRPRDKPPPIKLEDFVADICFHPKQDILAVANIVGDVILYTYSNEENVLLDTIELHTKACRDIEFNSKGETMFTASKDLSIMLTDVETRKLKQFYEKAHDHPIYCLAVIDENTFATGDDNGAIKLWDWRQRNSLLTVEKNEDFISDIIAVDNNRYLCCSSGDGSLTTIDLSYNKFLIQSVEYDEELTCLGTVRHESKVVASSNKGKLFLFNMREFGMHSDEFPGTKSPVSKFVPITENIVVTACEDGNLRAVHLFPHRHIGIVGQHEMSVENIDICNDGRFLASNGADNDIKFWNIEYFEDFERVSQKHNKHNTKKEMEFNLPSSSKKNVAEFFSDLA